MHKIDMEKKDYIVGIDIGSSNVAVAVGVRKENGEVSVLGVEVQEIEDCVKNGDILNYVDLGKAIDSAKKALEEDLGRNLNSAYVGVSGKSVYCVRYEDYVDINSHTACVTEIEMRELTSRIDMVVPGGGDEIIARMPLRYRIDDRQNVKNPIGAYGRKLAATYLFVMVGKQQVDLVNRAMHYAGLKVDGLCVNPTILPQLLLSEHEMNEGAMIVDIGSDLTDISIVQEGKLWYFSSLPIGASSINNDLREFLRIPKKDIDLLKRRYGSATAEGVPEDISIPVKTTGHAKKQILQRNIAEIAEERLKDIAAFVIRELKAAKFTSQIPCGVVLTGGSAYLSNIEELFARELSMEVRLGYTLNGLDDESQEKVVAFPQSVVLGLLIYGAQHNACETSAMKREDSNTNIPEQNPLMPKFEPMPVTPKVEPKPLEPKEDKPIIEERPEQEPEHTPEPNDPTQEVAPEKEEQQEEQKPEQKPEIIDNKKPQDNVVKKTPKRSFMERIRETIDGIFNSDDQYI